MLTANSSIKLYIFKYIMLIHKLEFNLVICLIFSIIDNFK